MTEAPQSAGSKRRGGKRKGKKKKRKFGKKKKESKQARGEEPDPAWGGWDSRPRGKKLGDRTLWGGSEVSREMGSFAELFDPNGHQR